MRTPTRYVSKAGRVTWRVRFRLDNADTSETFDTRAEAARFAELLDVLGPERALEEVSRVADDGTPTLDQWAARHFAALAASVTPGTLTSYRRIYSRRWAAPLGDTRIDKLTREQVAVALGNCDGADKTIRNAWGVLASMLKQAVVDGLIPRSPAAGVRLPRASDHERVEHRYLTRAEFGRLLDATPDHWLPLVWMLAGTGMRWGEATALEVGDVDLDAGTVRIVKAVKWDPSTARHVIGPTKTRRSRRTVWLPGELLDILPPLLDRPRTDRLFVAPRGGDVRHRTFWSDVWLPAVKKAELGEPRPRPHDLRHSHVAWLIAQGVGLPTIQDRLGHENITTTIDTYGHLLPDVRRQAAQAASVVFAGLPARQIEP